MSIKTFFESPANRSGVATAVGTAIAAGITYAVTGQVPTSAAVLGFAISVVQIVRPDNSLTVAQLGKTLSDIQLALQKRDFDDIAAAFEDVLEVAKSAGVQIPPAAPALSATTTPAEPTTTAK